jgi:hypothetical protein
MGQTATNPKPPRFSQIRNGCTTCRVRHAFLSLQHVLATDRLLHLDRAVSIVMKLGQLVSDGRNWGKPASVSISHCHFRSLRLTIPWR